MGVESLANQQTYVSSSYYYSIVYLPVCEFMMAINSQHVVPIHILDDDSLLNIFYLYRPNFLGEDDDDLDRLTGGRESWNRGRWWYQLVHVCQRWRNLILGSASYLRLSLVCTNGTLVENVLADSPHLPLTVDYMGWDSITAEDEEGILLALKQRHRIRHLRLFFPERILRRLFVAIEGEFPILELLIVVPWPKNTALMLPETLQTPNLHHLTLFGFVCPIRSRLHPTATGLVTLCLLIDHQSAYFQPNVLLQWILFMPRLENLEITFTLPASDGDAERQLTYIPITTHITLPNLQYFRFRGDGDYLEGIVRWITTPRLENLHIRLFQQLTFSFSHLPQFMKTTVHLKFDSVNIMFEDERIHLTGTFREADTHIFSARVDCWLLDQQVSSGAQICNALSQVLSAVDHLKLDYEIHSLSSEEHNDVRRIEWRNLLRSFSNVKTLHVEGGLVEEISRCLRLEDGELPLELLPELRQLRYPGIGDAGDPFTSFIDARQNADRPVTLVRDSLRSFPSPSPSSFEPPAITSPGDEAENYIET